MKKSRIILPAVALLAVSGIASVTGTVAWFTASASKSFGVENVVAVSTSGNLTVAFSDATGCDINGDTITLKDLRDASVDLSTETVYNANFLDGAIANYGVVAAPTAVAYTTTVAGTQNVDVYNCAIFTGTFTLGGAASDSYALLLDGRASKSFLESASATIPGGANVFKSLRIGMIGADKTIVYAPWAGTSATYVNDTDASKTLPTYTVINTSSVSTAVADNAQTTSSIATNTTLLDAGIAGGSTSAVKFYVWFEGTDTTNCITSAEGVTTATGDAVAKALQLTFYATKLAA